MKLIDRYANNMAYYKDKALVMRVSNTMKNIKVGDILKMESDKWNRSSPQFSSLDGKYVCSFGSILDTNCLYLFDLTYAATKYADYIKECYIGLDKRVSLYNAYINSKRRYTDGLAALKVLRMRQERK